jgi:hypothetical protein
MIGPGLNLAAFILCLIGMQSKNGHQKMAENSVGHLKDYLPCLNPGLSTRFATSFPPQAHHAPTAQPLYAIPGDALARLSPAALATPQKILFLPHTSPAASAATVLPAPRDPLQRPAVKNLTTPCRAKSYTTFPSKLISF